VTALSALGRFLWDFVVGDDWTVAVGILLAIGVTAALEAGGVGAWWVIPLAVIATLYVSLRRATSR
jgi:hypothetical protein